MVYIDGDNNLEPYAMDDFLEMAQVGSSDDVHIVVQMDRAPGYDAGGWEDTRRFLIRQGGLPTEEPLAYMGEVNMGDPKALEDFIVWAMTSFPADNYALSIWNHGGGWRDLQDELTRDALAFAEADVGAEVPEVAVARAVCSDKTDNDILFLDEVQQALANAQDQTSNRLSIIGFDACLMGMLEVAYELRDYGDYMVASENTEPADGWPYHAILEQLHLTPTLSARDLATLIVTEYDDSYAGDYYGHAVTQAALDLSHVETVAAQLDTFASALDDEWDQIRAARETSRLYHPCCMSFWGVDLWHFADNVDRSVLSGDARTAARALKDAIDAFVVEERHGAGADGSYGIAIYFPESKTIFDNDPDHTGYLQGNPHMPVDFVDDHGWDEWLQLYFAQQ